MRKPYKEGKKSKAKLSRNQMLKDKLKKKINFKREQKT
jgi:hypothetical protein